MVAIDTRAQALFPGPDQASWPVYGMVDDIRPALADILEAGASGALATLVASDGPSPRPIGAQMAIALDGRAAGYVSGGCVEGSIVTIGREVAETGAPRLVVFGAGSPYVDVKLICGARIEVFVERLRPEDETLWAVLSARAARSEIVRTVARDGAASVRAPAAHESEAGVAEDGSVWRRYAPTTRLIVLGADPVALALVELARAMGMDTALARRLGPDAAPPQAPQLYLPAAPTEALDSIGLDAWTAVISTTHDLDDDHEALAYALPSEAFYVGALGSRRRVADRVAKLERAGIGWDAVRRLHAPVGLDIGAASPMEIALSVLADIVRARRGK